MKYGCHNKPREEGYWAKDGAIVKGPVMIQLAKYIKDTMSKDCRYDMKATDKKCYGCHDNVDA